jgi:hypothetical protein
MDIGAVMGTRVGAGAATEAFRLLWVLCVEGGCVVRCFSLAGLVRMVMRGGEWDWETGRNEGTSCIEGSERVLAGLLRIVYLGSAEEGGDDRHRVDE